MDAETISKVMSHISNQRTHKAGGRPAGFKVPKGKRGGRPKGYVMSEESKAKIAEGNRRAAAARAEARKAEQGRSTGDAVIGDTGMVG